MRTLLILVLVGFLQEIRAQERSSSSVITNSAPRWIKPLKADAGIDRDRRKLPELERSESSRSVVLSLSFDAKAKRFGAYDRTVRSAVENRWLDLLNNIKYDGYSTGKVVLEFQLHSDGRITEVKLTENNAGEGLGLLCQKAVSDQSPYPRWPKEMHKEIAADSRAMTLTFHYLPDEVHRKKAAAVSPIVPSVYPVQLPYDSAAFYFGSASLPSSAPLRRAKSWPVMPFPTNLVIHASPPKSESDMTVEFTRPLHNPQYLIDTGTR